ncbi:MAG: hypothetical protein QXS02_03830 [Candidatus Thermoplasmatota archaeon]
MMLDITRYIMVLSSTGTLSGIILMMILSLIWLVSYLLVYPLISHIVYSSAYALAEKPFISMSSLLPSYGVRGYSIGLMYSGGVC